MKPSVVKADNKPMIKLLRFLARGAAIVTDRDDTTVEVETGEGQLLVVPRALVDDAVRAGLVSMKDNRLVLEAVATAYMRRTVAAKDPAFGRQHADLEQRTVDVEGIRTSVQINRSESPLATLSRLKDRAGGLFFSPDAIAAGERLAADFMRGQLQPRITASWEPRIASRGKGERGGMADLTDSAMAGRLAVNRAVEALGPELAGVALDVCCFVKGLELVERERQWPARSAKLMLRTALMALARHYAPPPARSKKIGQHWGAEDFRPKMSGRPL